MAVLLCGLAGDTRGSRNQHDVARYLTKPRQQQQPPKQKPEDTQQHDCDDAEALEKEIFEMFRDLKKWHAQAAMTPEEEEAWKTKEEDSGKVTSLGNLNDYKFNSGDYETFCAEQQNTLQDERKKLRDGENGKAGLWGGIHAREEARKEKRKKYCDQQANKEKCKALAREEERLEATGCFEEPKSQPKDRQCQVFGNLISNCNGDLYCVDTANQRIEKGAEIGQCKALREGWEMMEKAQFSKGLLSGHYLQPSVAVQEGAAQEVQKPQPEQIIAEGARATLNNVECLKIETRSADQWKKLVYEAVKVNEMKEWEGMEENWWHLLMKSVKTGPEPIDYLPVLFVKGDSQETALSTGDILLLDADSKKGLREEQIDKWKDIVVVQTKASKASGWFVQRKWRTLRNKIDKQIGWQPKAQEDKDKDLDKDTKKTTEKKDKQNKKPNKKTDSETAKDQDFWSRLCHSLFSWKWNVLHIFLKAFLAVMVLSLVAACVTCCISAAKGEEEEKEEEGEKKDDAKGVSKEDKKVRIRASSGSHASSSRGRGSRGSSGSPPRRRRSRSKGDSGSRSPMLGDDSDGGRLVTKCRTFADMKAKASAKSAEGKPMTKHESRPMSKHESRPMSKHESSPSRAPRSPSTPRSPDKPRAGSPDGPRPSRRRSPPAGPHPLPRPRTPPSDRRR